MSKRRECDFCKFVWCGYVKGACRTMCAYNPIETALRKAEIRDNGLELGKDGLQRYVLRRAQNV